MTTQLPGKLSNLVLAASALFAITDAVSISIVTSISAVFMAGISAFFAYKAKTIAETTGKAVDGHLTEFKEMAKRTFTAEGVLQEKTEEQLRKADATLAKAEGVVQEKEVKTAVKEAVIESVKAPVKEAVLETFTPAQIDQIRKALKRK